MRDNAVIMISVIAVILWFTFGIVLLVSAEERYEKEKQKCEGRGGSYLRTEQACVAGPAQR